MAINFHRFLGQCGQPCLVETCTTSTRFNKKVPYHYLIRRVTNHTNQPHVMCCVFALPCKLSRFLNIKPSPSIFWWKIGSNIEVDFCRNFYPQLQFICGAAVRHQARYRLNVVGNSHGTRQREQVPGQTSLSPDQELRR